MGWSLGTAGIDGHQLRNLKHFLGVELDEFNITGALVGISASYPHGQKKIKIAKHGCSSVVRIDALLEGESGNSDS